MSDLKIELTAYCGSREEEVPRSFILSDDEIRVVSILARWLEEDVSGGRRKRFFKVRGDDGYTHLVSYDEKDKAWFLGGQ